MTKVKTVLFGVFEFLVRSRVPPREIDVLCCCEQLLSFYILGTFTEILEKLPLEQLRPHIIDSPKFPSCQSAHRSFHSTETALLKITNDLRCGMNNGSVSCLLSLDISKYVGH